MYVPFIIFVQFYHACDGNRVDRYMYCLTDYGILSIGDFLASTCSLWVTLVAMAQIPINYSAAIQVSKEQF